MWWVLLVEGVPGRGRAQVGVAEGTFGHRVRQAIRTSSKNGWLSTGEAAGRVLLCPGLMRCESLGALRGKTFGGVAIVEKLLW